MNSDPSVMIGIDLGARSIGWTVLTADVDLQGRVEPSGLIAAGVRCFEAGVEGNAKEIEAGKDKSRSVQRRMARGARRNLFRRSQRLRRTLRALAQHQFLPNAVISPPAARDQYLQSLDQELKQRMIAGGIPTRSVEDLPMYQLRLSCLDGPRSLPEIGRALYHLAQRRGFKSNRKALTRDDEKSAVR